VVGAVVLARRPPASDNPLIDDGLDEATGSAAGEPHPSDPDGRPVGSTEEARP